jgi:hypothetical protein
MRDWERRPIERRSLRRQEERTARIQCNSDEQYNGGSWSHKLKICMMMTTTTMILNCSSIRKGYDVYRALVSFFL